MESSRSSRPFWRPSPEDTRASSQSAGESQAADQGSDRMAYFWTKRVVDIAISLVLLVLLSPVLLLVALLIKLDSSGPVIFSQERAGYHWRRRVPVTFIMHKFRSMYHNSDQAAHRQFIRSWVRGEDGLGEGGSPERWLKLTNDPRVTRVGRFIRKTSLDELPQLWNVLIGEMSLVGPRPVPLYEVEEYQEWHRKRLEATPGITCFWQVWGRGHTNVDEMVRMDLEYIEKQSIWLDIKLLVLTIPVVFTGRGAA